MPCAKRGEVERHPLHSQQREQHQRRNRAAEHDGGGDVDAVVEREPCGDVIAAHHQRDQKQGGEGGTGERTRGRHG